MAVHDDALAERLALVLGGEVVSFSRTVSWPYLDRHAARDALPDADAHGGERALAAALFLS
jgi:hypothetical protein